MARCYDSDRAPLQRTRLRHADGTAVDVLLPCSVETFAKVCGALGKIGFELRRVDNPASEVMCACGHTAHWHSHGGVGNCEHDADCRCERLTEPEGDDGPR